MASKYGVKIKNIEAGTLYENNLGVRDYYSYSNAMFSNSLLLDFLLDNGLKVSKDGRTRDIIGINFSFGTKSYEETKNKIEEHLSAEQFKPQEEQNEEYISNLQKALERCNNNQGKYKKISVEDIRLEYYTDGVDVQYVQRDKEGKIKKIEIIHYKMLYRSSGKAKTGSCIFINKRLYKKAHNFIYMDYKLPKHNSPIVEASAYVSLVASSIVGTVKINPKDILVLKDVDSYFNREVISIETNVHKECIAKRIDNYRLKNTLFDGQALIDSSIFPSWGNGYILLRHHMTKCAAFKANIQTFFKDYFKEQYENAIVKDMFGNEHYAKDIKMITTDNALKFLKFNISYDYWCDKVYANGCKFGIVKTAHKSKLGEVQKMSYQMVNTLNEEIMDDVLAKSKEYVNALKRDDVVFLNYLRDNANFSNDYDVLVALCEQNPDFICSSYFRKRKGKIIGQYVKRLKLGKIIQEGDNLVMVGSPYAMLLHSVGENVEKDDTLRQSDGEIQCYTKRFKCGESIAGFRSPHNSKSNILSLYNVHSDLLDRYIDIGEQCIAVNCLHTDLQDRANGCDFDSDTIYCTNQPQIAQHAKDCYINYPTIVNNIPKEKNHYDYSLETYAQIDNNLAKAQRAIGESSNLAQMALTYSYNFADTKYEDYVSILSVLAQCAIDNAKRRFDIDLTAEIRRIKSDMNIKTHGYPKFWLLVRPDVSKSKINYNLKCPMNTLFDYKPAKIGSRSLEPTRPMSDFFIKHPLEENRRKSHKVEDLIERYSIGYYNNIKETYDALWLQDEFELLIEDIKRMYISQQYVGLFSWLIDRAFLISPNMQSNKDTISCCTNKNKAILLKTLYSINPKNLLKVFAKPT